MVETLLGSEAIRLRVGRRRTLQHSPGRRPQCILVLMGATADGKKELIAIADGYRESEQSWKEFLLDVKSRGLAVDPKLATGDGALGFWKALNEVWPSTREQRCCVHKTANVLDKLPKRLQPAAKEKLHAIWMADTREHAHQAFDLFLETYQAKYPKACECLAKDRDVLLGVLRLPRRALDTPANHQPDRVDVRHRQASPTQDQRQRHSPRVPHNGLQADGVSRKEMATPQRLQHPSRRHSRSSLRQRRTPNASRRLIARKYRCLFSVT